MRSTAYALVAGGQLAAAFPFIARMPGVDTSLLRRQQTNPDGPGSAATCPYNADHVPAPLVNDKFPYNNAKNGIPGNGKGGFVVPDPNDPDHQFIAPDPSKDIRGVCPGLNAAANHGFLARDGISTYTELVDMVQNVYNIGWDVGIFLATISVGPLGDLTTSKLSIGCDATTRTSANPALTGSEPGLDGHNKFEADSSLTRNDYFLADGDDYTMNGTLFGMMIDSTKGVFSVDTIAQYRYERYEQSLQENKNFYFGPFSVLLYAAAGFLYNVFPSGPSYVADTATIASFWGAHQNEDGTWSAGNDEKIPANWTNRESALHIPEVVESIVEQYARHPVLFGGNTGNGQFDTINFGDNGEIKNGSMEGLDAAAVTCLLYQIATERVPSSLDSFVEPVVNGADSILTKLNPAFENLGCPLKLT